MDEFEGRQVTPTSKGLTLLTGAASGIGRELARVFAANGHDLVLVDIDESGLEAVESMLATEPGTVRDRIVVDLTDEGAIDRVENRVRALEHPLAILVNNAGVPVYGHFSETTFEDERRLLRLNVEALTALTDRFLPGMLERGRGRILNTASLAGVVPVPTAAVYGGSKAYVHSFSLALADELGDTPVTVTALCPGETETGFMERGGMERSAVADGELMSPKTVARIGYDGLMDGKRVVVPGWRNRIRYRLSRLLPAWLGGRLAKRLWAGSG
ncbi:SDR family NAD(P)-dependent oxidoreductase [Natronosalvus amylolyticus]|uniref:SDR family NAD(P)-dependent oxidoreductase n=1 Tax=Natronosalvus amylolyticus TaxID=2961994 RepID=UPI0020C9D4E4|nr:SDR family oxidoreductase [Natronosalvus amylolyticus]